MLARGYHVAKHVCIPSIFVWLDMSFCFLIDHNDINMLGDKILLDIIGERSEPS